MHFAIPALGGCYCGRIRYRITEEPLTLYICHCYRCQKRTSSAFSMSIVLPTTGMHLEKGSPAKTERTLANGSKDCSYVCGQCYSRLYTRRDGSPTVSLRAGTLDDTSRIRPVAQIWTSSAQAWAIMEEDRLLSYTEEPADFGRLIEAWSAAH